MLVCLQAGFRKVLLRGDTDFSQSQHLDGWNLFPRVRFIFGFDALPNLVAIAEQLPAKAWRRLVRPVRYQVHTQPRRRPVDVKDRIVRERGYETLRLQSEDVAEFEYRPGPAATAIAWWLFARTSRWKRASRFCSRTNATSSTSPTNATARPRRSSSRPTAAATKRT